MDESRNEIHYMSILVFSIVTINEHMKGLIHLATYN